MKRILFISHDSDLVGAEQCLLRLLTCLDKTKFEAFVLLPQDGPLAEETNLINIENIIRYIPRWIPSRKNADCSYFFNYLRNWRAYQWSLLQLIKNENIDLIYTNTSTVLEGALAAQRAGIPHIWHIHEYLDNNPDIYSYIPNKIVDKVIIKLSDQIISPSRTLAVQRFGALKKVRVVNNGVNLNTFLNGDGARIRKELQIPIDTPIITFVGAIAACKDPLTFIHAAAQIIKSKPSTQFLIAGNVSDEPLNNALKELIYNMRLSTNIHLLGFRSDIHDLLATATVHVSTSTQESFGLTLIEAMASHKPVVATRCGGPEEVVVDGKTGFIVETKDPEAIAKAIMILLNNPETAKQFGDAGYTRVKEQFTTQAYAKRISSIIKESCS